MCITHLQYRCLYDGRLIIVTRVVECRDNVYRAFCVGILIEVLYKHFCKKINVLVKNLLNSVKNIPIFANSVTTKIKSSVSLMLVS